MPAHFIASPLDGQHIAQAFPLISLEVPGLTIDRWRAFARAQVASRRGGERGILVARNPAGYIHGLVFFQIVDDLRDGRVLLASHLIAARSVGCGEIVSALIGAILKMAHARDCAVVRATLPVPKRSGGDGDHWLVSQFRRAGFDLCTAPEASRAMARGDLAISLSTHA